MLTRRLGASGLAVSRLGLGTMAWGTRTSPEDARDLSQEVFLRVYQRLSQYRHESALATWIGRVAFSVATRHLILAAGSSAPGRMRCFAKKTRFSS